MTRLHKFSLKKFCFPFAATAFCLAITWKSEAGHTHSSEIYSTLTSDTIPAPKKDTVPGLINRDSLTVSDTLPPTQTVDTFHFKYSKDTLDAPVNYEAMDSGVLLVREKKFLLYGKTKTTYKDVTLTAPMVSLDQATNVLTAVNAKDSSGTTIARAQFQQGTESFQSDTIEFNFKTQRGITRNTYTTAQEMYVHGDLIKKINANTTFAKRVTMTTCDYDDPHFGFVSNKGKFINQKIAVTGPIHPEFEGVPIPIYLPFGIFPLKQGRHSGLLPPRFTVTDQFGIGLEGLGYYQVLNDYLDVTVRSNIYSYGGWSFNVIPTYRKRYKYNGAFSFNIQHTKFNFKGDPDYNLVKTFNISWNHSVDQRARPGTNFSANVNAGSTKYNQYLANDPNRNFQNQLTSSIAYSKTWQDKPFNLTMSANHTQNNVTHDVRITLPDAGFTVTTLYPFQRKNLAGSAKWYEKIGVGYSGVMRNQLAFYDTAQNTLHGLIDTMMWGAQHRFPISMSLPPAGPLLISPFVSYEETWLTNRFHRQYNPLSNQIDTFGKQKGLFIDRQMSFGIGVNTSIFGTFLFKRSKVTAIRHVIRPTINFNYRPNLSKKYYDKVDRPNGGSDYLPQFDFARNLFQGYGYGEFGGISFAVDNNLEMKIRGKKDTTAEGHKVKLIDGFGFNSGYNFLADTMQLLPFNLYLRTTLFEKVSITAQALYNPYQQDSLGNYFNKFVWQGNRFSLGRLNTGSISMSTSFQSKPRDPKKAPTTPINQTTTDRNVLADRERLQDYVNRNPAEFVDFNIPWSISLSYSLFFSSQLNVATQKFKTKFTSNLSFNNSFSLTPKWNFTTNGYYDFNTMQLTMFTMSVSRDMHCWQMSVNVTPIGSYPSFNITLNPKSTILQDLRVNRTRTFYNY
jgi:LPS-assembly protein